MATAKGKAEEPEAEAAEGQTAAAEPKGGSTPDDSAVKQVLRMVEYAGIGDGGAVKCLVCGQAPALDPKNARDFEGHADDCLVAAAIDEVGGI
jgi:hypothetical protein